MPQDVKIIYLGACFVLLFACLPSDSDYEPSCTPDPTLITNEVTAITQTSAKLAGKIIAPTCNAAVIYQGFVYSKETLPTTDDTITKVNGENIDSVVNDLEPDSEYFVRSFLKTLLVYFTVMKSLLKQKKIPTLSIWIPMVLP